ncbi:MAG: hypothetical protein PHR60_03155 [Eubacteriales bacterium]|nr:hypothetical protein [Eubacteriales bacterium]MDD4583171.1 hypothetical protein [Eubacteriales bacterium]
MNCGVKFCGGCNPRYQRGDAFKYIKEHFKDQIQFEYAKEGVIYDLLLIIGGCTNCCASYNQYQVKLDIVKMWCTSQIKQTINNIEKILQNQRR